MSEAKKRQPVVDPARRSSGKLLARKQQQPAKSPSMSRSVLISSRSVATKRSSGKTLPISSARTPPPPLSSGRLPKTPTAPSSNLVHKSTPKTPGARAGHKLYPATAHEDVLQKKKKNETTDLKKRNRELLDRAQRAEKAGQCVLARWQSDMQGVRKLLEELAPMLGEHANSVKEQLAQLSLTCDQFAGVTFSQFLANPVRAICSGTSTVTKESESAAATASQNASEKTGGLKQIEEEDAGTEPKDPMAECYGRYVEYRETRQGKGAETFPGFMKSLAQGNRRRCEG